MSDSPAGNGDARCCTTRRAYAHKTEVSQEREVLYRWHPWAGCVVRIHETVEKVDGIVLRCSRDGSAGRWLELPDWMFDRAVCLPMRIARDPWIEFAALSALRELLTGVASPHGHSLTLNTPVLSAADEACENRGNTHATSKPTPSDRPQTRPSARPIRFAGSGGPRSADTAVASAAGRNTPVGDGADGPAPTRSRPRGSPSGSDEGGR